MAITAPAVSQESFAKPDLNDSARTTCDMLVEGQTMEQIAAARDLKISTIANHASAGIFHGLQLPLEALPVSKALLDDVEMAISALDSTPRQCGLKLIKDELDSQRRPREYFEIKLAQTLLAVAGGSSEEVVAKFGGKRAASCDRQADAVDARIGDVDATSNILQTSGADREAVSKFNADSSSGDKRRRLPGWLSEAEPRKRR